MNVTILKEKEFVSQSLNWPRWPMLPVKARNGHLSEQQALGFLYSFDREPRPIVYFGNIYRVKEIADKIKGDTGKDSVTWQEILGTMQHREFPSIDALLEVYRLD